MVLYHHLYPEVIKVIRKLIIEDERLKEYSRIYKKELDRSLRRETYEDSTIKSYVTHVNKLPTGTESGKFLALEFVSPVVRVMLMELSGSDCSITAQQYRIPRKLMTGKSEKLFDFLAQCVSRFLQGIKLKMLRIPLGVTFGFPIEQITLQDCLLSRWAQGFQCNDMIGENIFKKLNDSIRKFPDLKRIYVIGILNETVSLLLACTVEEPKCKIALVAGDFISCCYAEKVSRISKYEAETYGEKNMYMNLDVGMFGEDGSIEDFRCEFDLELDKYSGSPGKLTTEKMTSWKYFGELARLALVRCIENKLILGGELTPRIQKRKSLNYLHLIRIESDPEDNHEGCREILRLFGYDNVSDEDCVQIQFVCRCVSRRAANLVAAQLLAILNKINEPKIAIALEGDMVKKYPNFAWYMFEKLVKLKKEKQLIKMVQTEENGLARGAAMVAAVFGEQVMDKYEKLRRLPGFPVARCHFRQTGRCLNPNCNAKRRCDAPKPVQQPMQTKSQDLLKDCLNQEECPAKKEKNVCAGYDQL